MAYQRILARGVPFLFAILSFFFPAAGYKSIGYKRTTTSSRIHFDKHGYACTRSTKSRPFNGAFDRPAISHLCASTQDSGTADDASASVSIPPASQQQEESISNPLDISSAGAVDGEIKSHEHESMKAVANVRSPSFPGIGKLSNLRPGFWILNFVAVLWGTQHVIIKTALTVYPAASVLNFWRFALSALLFSPSLIQALRLGSVNSLRAGLELGFYTFLGFGFQSIGLLTTTASRSAFLLYLNVKFVPIFAAIFLKRKIPASTWGSAFLALLGTALLSTDGGPFTVGDAWCLAAAAASAMFILRLEALAKKVDAAELNGASFATVAFLCFLWMLGDGMLGSDVPKIATAAITTGAASAGGFGAEGMQVMPLLHWDFPRISSVVMEALDPLLQNPFPVLYLGLITTGLCNYLQTLGQREVSAERAAIIYSMDPVYAAFFSRVFLGEELSGQGYAGALLIMSGIWLSNSRHNNAAATIDSNIATLMTDVSNVDTIVDASVHADEKDTAMPCANSTEIANHGSSEDSKS